MQLGYEPDQNLAILFATPDEMRLLADIMEDKLKTAKPGDSLTVIQLKSVDGWTGEPANLVLKISADR
jgi:hypothetical protein